MQRIKLWTSRRIAMEIFDLTDEKDIKNKMAWIRDQYENGDIRASVIGSKKHYNPDDFKLEFIEHPKDQKGTVRPFFAKRRKAWGGSLKALIVLAIFVSAPTAHAGSLDRWSEPPRDVFSHTFGRELFLNTLGNSIGLIAVRFY